MESLSLNMRDMQRCTHSVVSRFLSRASAAVQLRILRSSRKASDIVSTKAVRRVPFVSSMNSLASNYQPCTFFVSFLVLFKSPKVLPFLA